MRSTCQASTTILMLVFWLLNASNAQDNDGIIKETKDPRVKHVLVKPVSDSLEADMLGLLGGAEQGRVNVIKGEFYVSSFQKPEEKGIGEEEKKKLRARLTGTSFKLKLDETRTWQKILEVFDQEIRRYLSGKKKCRILAGPDTALNNNKLTITACLRLVDTVYVWTPGCNCPKPKSSALATCAVVLEASAMDREGRAVWGKREPLFYAGLEESLEEAFSARRVKDYVRRAFGPFK